MPVISGKAYWAKVYTPQASKFNPEDFRYSIDVGNLDKKNIKIATDHGLEVKQDEREGGEKGNFITIRRYANKKDGSPNPKPKVVDASLSPMNSHIGNGSDVNVQFRPYTYKNGSYKGKMGFSLETVQVTNLIEYIGTSDGSSNPTELKPVEGGYEETGAPF